MSQITDTTELRTIEECAAFARIDAEKLARLIRTGRGVPTATSPTRGVLLVVGPEFLEWLNRRRVAGPEIDAVLAVARPARNEAARRRLVRVEDRRRGTSASS